MLPIIHAYAISVHKLQGTTVERAVVNLSSQYSAPAQPFVPLTRVRSLGVEIDKIDPNKLMGDNVCHKDTLEELQHLQSLPPFHQQNN